MYSICNIVCGFQIPEKVLSMLNEINFFDFKYKEISSLESIGVKSLYSGTGDNPIFCGDIIYSFNEFQPVDTKKLISYLTMDQKKFEQAKKKMDFTKNSFLRINEVFKELLEKAGASAFIEEECFSKEEINEMMECLPKDPSIILIWSHS